jgi:hypothetical protein
MNLRETGCMALGFFSAAPPLKQRDTLQCNKFSLPVVLLNDAQFAATFVAPGGDVA